MKKPCLLLALAWICMLPANAQLTTDNSQTAAWIVQNVLLGSGVTVSNVTFSGDPLQLGTFDGVNSNCGLNQGMLMSTGEVSGAVGPNDAVVTNPLGGFGGAGDSDLDDLTATTNQASTTEDAAILEFDFVPQGDSLKFNYVFSSEEYLTFVGTVYNDVFGFFLSGPGINGPYINNAINLATIPGTTQAVAISSLNNLTNSAYYIDNGDGYSAPQNTDPTVIQYNGLSVVLQAFTEVVCGETYHIKIAIGDAGDPTLDSGVFLEAGSFTSNQLVFSSESNFTPNDSTIFEGCGSTVLHIVRNGDISMADTVLIVTGGSATNGIDYTLVEDSLFFAAGEDSLEIFISALSDAIIEGVEIVDIMAIIETPCNIDTLTYTFYIADAPLIDVLITPSASVTCGDSAYIETTITGGFGSYLIDWNTGIPDGETEGWVNPSQTTDYTVSVTDSCGVVVTTAQSTVSITPSTPIITGLTQDTTVFCPESPVVLNTNVSGGTGPYSYVWGQGLGTGTSANVAPAVTTTYDFTVVDDCGADVTEQITVTVQYDTLAVTVTNDTSVCVGTVVDLFADATSGYNGYTYLWSNGATDPAQPVMPGSTTTYSVVATDACGISATDAMTVVANQPMAAFSWAGNIQVENLPMQFFDNSFGALQWSWDFGDEVNFSDAQNPIITYTDDGIYNVMLAVWDALGCSDTAYMDVEILPEYQFYAPNAFTPDGDGNNDFFFGNGVGIMTYELQIFDRWGSIVFETNLPYGNWNGVVDGGTLAPAGVYVYKFRLTSFTGQVEEKLGHVTLVR